MLFSTLQMKNLFCKKLAACLCMKRSNPSWEPPLIYAKRSRYVGTGDNRIISSLHRGDSTENDSVKEVMSKMLGMLQKVLGLLETRAHTEEVQSYENRKEDEMKKDWMLAAAVVDRICAIAFIILFLAGTLAFIILATTRTLGTSASVDP